MAGTRYHLESLVPSWLAHDHGYLAALGEHLVARMKLQGWNVVTGPAVAPFIGPARVPVGMVLLRAEVTVEEFDLDMADDRSQQWAVHQTRAGEAHVLPLDDLIVHDADGNCPCGPTRRPERLGDGSQGWVITHHSLDGREQYEPDTGV